MKRALLCGYRVGTRTPDGDVFRPPPDHVPVDCAGQCGHQVWAGRRLRALSLDTGQGIFCPECGLGRGAFGKRGA